MDTKNRKGHLDKERQAQIDRGEVVWREIECGRNKNGHWRVKIEGVYYSLHRIYEVFGIAERTMRQKLLDHRLNMKNAAKAIQFMIFKADAGLPQKEQVYFSPCGKCWCTISTLRAQTPMNHNTAYRRLRDWQDGTIGADGLFAPIDSEARKRGRKKGRKTYRYPPDVAGQKKIDAAREARLAHIPGPTPIERQLYGY